MENATISLTECPRCSSTEFVIERYSYPACEEFWARCRQCDLPMGTIENMPSEVRSVYGEK